MRIVKVAACRHCGKLLGKYSGKGRPPAVCESCKRTVVKAKTRIKHSAYMARYRARVQNLTIKDAWIEHKAKTGSSGAPVSLRTGQPGTFDESWLDNRIKKIQEGCPHGKWDYVGSPRPTERKCRLCGKTEKL